MKVILFDGVCNLCNGSVNWVIDHDKKELFKFAALQSDFGKQTISKAGLTQNYLNTIVLVDGSAIYTKADAVLEILKQIGGIYSLAVIFYVVPAFLRNYLYDIVAANRYKWFGKSDSCRVPTAELKARFLE